MALCRLCSTREQIFDVFHSQLTHGQQLRLSIFLATGIEIKENDLVSKMVCHRCCEIAVKLHKYRINAITNDKLLKEQCGQPYTKPIINQEDILRLASKIASEQINADSENGNNPADSNSNSNSLQILSQSSASHSQSKDSIINDNTDPSKHPSIHKLYNDCENIILPEEVFESDIFPVVSLDSAEVSDWYAEQANSIQRRLTNLVIKKIPSDCGLTAATYKYSITSENDEAKTNVPSPDTASPMDTNCTGIENNYDSDDMDRSDSISNCQDENDASTINTTPNTSCDHPIEKPPMPLPRIVNQKLKKKPARKPFAARKRSVSDDEDEVIPEKKIRGYKNIEPKNVLNKIDLPNQLPRDKTQQKNIFTSSLELAHTGVSSTSTDSVATSSSCVLESTLVSSELPPFSVVSSTTTPSASHSELDPNGLLLEHADREHIMIAEQTLSVFFCSVCNKLCDSQQQLKDHEKVHLRCKFCKIRVKSIRSLNRHLSKSCLINIVKNPPNLQLTRVEYIPEVVEKYPEAFEELFTLNDISCYAEEDGFGIKTEPIFMNNGAINNDTTQSIVGNPSNEVTEVEVVCLLDDSEEEVECTETPRHATVKNAWFDGKDNRSDSTITGVPGISQPKSTNPLTEREVILSLFTKYDSPVDSQSDVIPTNKMWGTNNNKNEIMIQSLVPELHKHKIAVLFRPDSSFHTEFQKKPSSTTKRILDSWVDKKVVDIRKPYTPYGSRSVLQAHFKNITPTNKSVPQTNTNVILNGKQTSLIVAKPSVATTSAKPIVATTSAKPIVATTSPKPSVATTSAKPTVSKPVIKISPKSNSNVTTTNLNKITIVTSTAASNKGNSNITPTITQISSGVSSLIKGTVVGTTSGPTLLNSQPTVNAVPYPTLIVPQGNLVSVLQNNQQSNVNTKYVVLAPQNIVQQLPPLVYTNSLPAATYQPTMQINQAPQQSIATSTSVQSTLSAIQTTNVTTEPIASTQGGMVRVKDLRELMGTQCT